MRPLASLVHARTRVRPRYALMPLEGYPFSRLPTFPDAQVRVLASPALGAKFVQYRIDLPSQKKGHFSADKSIQTFYYVLSGTGFCGDANLTPGSFGLLPPGHDAAFRSSDALSLLILRKTFVPLPDVPQYAPLHDHADNVEKQHWNDNPHSQLQLLIPDEFQYDLAMNIFTFSPGHGLPIVETHVMEHGALVLSGKGVYLLGEDWMEVEKDDFIYMAPYCPQSFYATGPTPASYIYYKDVNRDITI